MGKKRDVDYIIHLEDKYGAQVYKDRLVLEKDVYQSRGLMSPYKNIDMLEERIRGLASLLNQQEGDSIMRHPRHDILLVINRTVGAEAAYLLSCGDYVQRQLDIVSQFVKPGDRVLNIGAGLGVIAMKAAQISGEPVLAVEPNEDLHAIIVKNAALNKVQVDVEKGCVVAGQKEGETDFYIAPQLWSSSIFVENQEEGEGEVKKVPVVSLEKLTQQHKANFLFLDVQGAEIGLLDDTDLKSFSRVVVRIHTSLIGEKATASVVNAVMKQGFELKDIQGWCFCFEQTE